MPSSGQMFKESNLVVISKGITPLPEVKSFKSYSWSSSEHFLNFLSSFGSLKINFLHSFFKPFLSSLSLGLLRNRLTEVGGHHFQKAHLI